MKAIIQRVSSAKVKIRTECKAAIKKGLLLLLGIGNSDSEEDIQWLCKKIVVTWTQIPQAPGWLWALASALGLLSVALLMANNIRDIPSDRESGKKTLAVRLGDMPSRGVYVACFAFAIGILGGVVSFLGFPVSVVLLALVVTSMGAAPAVWVLASGRRGSALIPAIKRTGLFTLTWAVEISVFLVLA